MPQRERVVVTGTGAISALGEDARSQWEVVLRGESGVTVLDSLAEQISFPPDAGQPIAAGRVRGLDPTEWIADKKALRAMRLHSHMAFAATDHALASAKLHSSNVNFDSTGIMLAVPMIDYDIADLDHAARRSRNEVNEFDIEKFCRSGRQAISPMLSIVMLNNATLCQIAMQYQLRGPNASFSPFGEAGGQAIGEALRVLQDGDAPVMLAGGVSPRLNLSALQRIAYLNILAETSTPAATSCRPFDRDRTGTVPGEGAAMLVLETLSHARSRGAHIFAEVLGHGAAVGVTDEPEPYPSSAAIAAALASALDDAETATDRLDCIYADAPGLPCGDAREADAILAVLGEQAPTVAVTSTKGATGHMLAAALPLQCIFAAYGFTDRQVPPVTNLRYPDSDIKLDLVQSSPRPIGSGAITACLAAGFQGQSECVVLGEFDPRGA